MDAINYDGKEFKTVSNSENGQTSGKTLFRYVQKGSILTAIYSGGKIVSGHLIGIVDKNGVIDMRYHQVDEKGVLQTGICKSIPEILIDGRIRLHEKWKWTSGDGSEGVSVIEECLNSNR